MPDYIATNEIREYNGQKYRVYLKYLDRPILSSEGVDPRGYYAFATPVKIEEMKLSDGTTLTSEVFLGGEGYKSLLETGARFSRKKLLSLVDYAERQFAGMINKMELKRLEKKDE